MRSGSNCDACLVNKGHWWVLVNVRCVSTMFASFDKKRRTYSLKLVWKQNQTVFHRCETHISVYRDLKRITSLQLISTVGIHTGTDFSWRKDMKLIRHFLLSLRLCFVSSAWLDFLRLWKVLLAIRHGYISRRLKCVQQCWKIWLCSVWLWRMQIVISGFGDNQNYMAIFSGKLYFPAKKRTWNTFSIQVASCSQWGFLRQWRRDEQLSLLSFQHFLKLAQNWTEK